MKDFKPGTCVVIIKVVHRRDKEHEGGGGFWLTMNRNTNNKTGFVWLPWSQIVVEVKKISEEKK